MPNVLKITAQSIYDELVKRNINVEIVDVPTGLLKVKSGNKSFYVQGSLMSRSSAIGMSIADKKSSTAKIANSIGMRQPETIVFENIISAKKFLDEYKKIVVKPNDAAHGYGVTVNVDTDNKLDAAIKAAMLESKSRKVLLQHQITGHDIRVLMIDGSLAASAIRSPASVCGDGQHTIAKLIDIENDNPSRGKNYQKSLNFIDITAAQTYLGRELNERIPFDGEVVQVVGTANIGTGGMATDVTESVPKEIVHLSSRLMSELNLQCCGVDFITSSINDPTAYYFIEANASPSFGLHIRPTIGKPREVQKLFVDAMLTDHSVTSL